MISQILAVLIFLVMFTLIITERFPKQFTTLASGALTLILVFGIGMQLDNHFYGKNYNSVNSIVETINVKSIFTPQFWYTAAGEKKTDASVSEKNTAENSVAALNSSENGPVVSENEAVSAAEVSQKEKTEESGEGESKGIDWGTIFFLAGMMIMVEGMAHAGFFRWLCLRLAKAVKYQVMPIFIVFMLMSSILSMFIDSITVILFLAAVTVELSVLLKFTPVPMILAEIFCANLGGSSTMCGDPPNIIIGSKLGYSFMDFLTNTGLMAGVCLVFVIIYFYFVCRKELSKRSGEVDASKFPVPEDAITDKKGFAVSCVIFALAVVLLVTHANTHLSVATIGLGIAAITLITSIKHAGALLKKVDTQTLLFFIGLFVVVGGLEQTGILTLIAEFIKNVSGGNPFVMIGIIVWVSAFASAFIDNIPFAATMVPVISALSAETGVALSTMAYALSMGTDIGGSGTPIGASANVVGTSVSAKSGHPIGWGKYCKICAPATIMVLLICTAMIFIRYLR